MFSNTPPWPAGVGRHVVAEIDSTMTAALRLPADGPAHSWVLALRQTAGYGRRGRAWVDPVGNFAATLSMQPAPPPAAAALRSFTAGLALAEALDRLTGQGARLRLKWPNDLLFDGGKIAGILLERDGGRLAIGIGVNLVRAPQASAVEKSPVGPLSVLETTGIHIEPETLLDHLAPAFETWEERLQQEGFAPVRAAFLARAARLGERISARTGRMTTTGIFETIDPAGALVLATPDGQVSVPAGDIFF